MKQNKGKKCPGGYWIPKKFKCGGSRKARPGLAAGLGAAAVLGVAGAAAVSPGKGGRQAKKGTRRSGEKPPLAPEGKARGTGMEQTPPRPPSPVSPPTLANPPGAGIPPSDRDKSEPGSSLATAEPEEQGFGGPSRGNRGAGATPGREGLADLYTSEMEGLIEAERERFRSQYKDEAVEYLRGRLGQNATAFRPAATYPDDQVAAFLRRQDLVERISGPEVYLQRKFGRSEEDRKDLRAQTVLSMVSSSVSRARRSNKYRPAAGDLDKAMKSYVDGCAYPEMASLILEGELEPEGTASPAGRLSQDIRDSFFRVGGKKLTPQPPKVRERGEPIFSYYTDVATKEAGERVKISGRFETEAKRRGRVARSPSPDEEIRAGKRVRSESLDALIRLQKKLEQRQREGFRAGSGNAGQGIGAGEYEIPRSGPSLNQEEKRALENLRREFGVSEASSPGEVARVKRELGRKYHPDLNPGQDPDEARLYAVYNSLLDFYFARTDSRLFFDSYPRWDSELGIFW